MIKAIRKTMDDQSGFVLVSVILVLAIISLAGIYAIRTASTEGEIVRNDQIYEERFYYSESAIIDTLVNYTSWLNDDTNILTSPGTAGVHMDLPITDATNTTLATVSVDIRATQSVATTITSWYDTSGVLLPAPGAGNPDMANFVPVMTHTAPPPKGSGYSAEEFETRRYVVTATVGNIEVQAGGFKVFAKSGD